MDWNNYSGGNVVFLFVAIFLAVNQDERTQAHCDCFADFIVEAT